MSQTAVAAIAGLNRSFYAGVEAGNHKVDQSDFQVRELDTAAPHIAFGCGHRWRITDLSTTST